MREERTEEAISIHRFKVELASQIFGKDSKKYICELRNLAYFYQNSEYYSETIEILELLRQTIKGTEEVESRWSEFMFIYNEGICFSEINEYHKAKGIFFTAKKMLDEVNEKSYHSNIVTGSLYTELGIVLIKSG